MFDPTIKKMFVVMLFFAFTLFFISSNARITQGGLDLLHNVQLSEDSSKRAVSTRPNPLHNDYPPLPGPPHLKQNLGCVWIELILLKLKTEN